MLSAKNKWTYLENTYGFDLGAALLNVGTKILKLVVRWTKNGTPIYGVRYLVQLFSVTQRLRLLLPPTPCPMNLLRLNFAFRRISRLIVHIVTTWLFYLLLSFNYCLFLLYRLTVPLLLLFLWFFYHYVRSFTHVRFLTLEKLVDNWQSGWGFSFDFAKNPLFLQL